jgi:transcriptional regulator GlxA family with amidase domain
LSSQLIDLVLISLFFVQGKIITSAGVSSGIDMALHLIAAFRDEETAKMVQLFVEYDPQPPYDAGSSSKAGEEIVAKTLELAKGLNRNLDASS